MSALPLTDRRGFVGGMCALAGANLLPSVSLPHAATHPSSPWDMSWVDKLARRTHKVAFDTTVIDDGIALDHASMIFDQFHDVFSGDDSQTGVVLVMRQNGTVMGFADELWERYPLGDDPKLTDPETKKPARRNPFYAVRPNDSPNQASNRIERLMARGAIVLVCNNATTNIARSMARTTGKDVETVVADFRQHLVPGAILLPSGVFAMICAQNAGCAFMRAS
jgi:hypothetical protein